MNIDHFKVTGPFERINEWPITWCSFVGMKVRLTFLNLFCLLLLFHPPLIIPPLHSFIHSFIHSVSSDRISRDDCIESPTSVGGPTSHSDAMESRLKENLVDSRIKKVLSNRYDNSLILESLDTINDYILSHGNTIVTRKTLRNDIELQNISINKSFLLEYSKVFASLQALHSQCQDIERECQAMSSQVNRANENIKLFLERATELEERGGQVIKQKENIESFLHKFQLTQEEIDELHSLSFTHAPHPTSHGSHPSHGSHGSHHSGPNILTDNFFQILKKLRMAYRDCKEMVELHQYSAGYELLDLLSHHQDIAYQKLFQWVKLRCDTNAVSSSSHGDPATDDLMLQTALSYLREVPSYFIQCQELVISSRRSLIVQRFVLAVTQGQQSSSSSGARGGGDHPSLQRSSSRAGFEMHSYDPVRFVGDMLAWTHQAIASEEEFLRAIFGTSLQYAPKPSSPSASTSTTSLEEEDSPKEFSNSIPELMVRCLSGLGRPLKVRILQTLENLRSSTSSSGSSSSSHGTALATLYLLCDLIQFYSRTYSRILPLDNSIHSAVEECFSECKKSFHNSLEKQVDQLKHVSMSLFTMDTLSTATTRDYCQLLTELLNIYQSSMALAHGKDPVTTEGHDDISLNHILECLIHPLLQSCRTCGNTAFGDNNFEMAIFMLNNVTLLKNTLQQSSTHSCREVTTSWISLLETEMQSWAQVLISENSNQILQRSEMDQALDLMEVLPSDMVASEQAGLSSERLGIMIRTFYSSLVNSNENLLDQLQDPELREFIRKGSSKKLLEAYRLVYRTISDPKNRYSNSKSLLSHSIHEVSVLLGCSSE